MSIDEELKSKIKEAEDIKKEIGILKSELPGYQFKGDTLSVQQTQNTIQRLQSTLDSLNEEIDRLKAQKDQGIIPTKGSTTDLFNNFDGKAYVKDVLEGMNFNPDGHQRVTIETVTSTTVEEELPDGTRNVFSTTDTQTEISQMDGGKIVKKDKSAQISLILKQIKDGKTINQACQTINVSVDEVNGWLESGRKGIGPENIGFYNEVKQLETSSNEITIDAKKVEDIKKPEAPGTPNSGSIKSDNSSSINENKTDKRKLMDSVLECLKDGCTYDEAAEQVNINPNLIVKWNMDGSRKVSDDAIYFYNEVNKINSSKHASAVKSNATKRGKITSKYNKGVSDNLMVRPEDSSYVSRGKIQDSKFVQPQDVPKYTKPKAETVTYKPKPRPKHQPSSKDKMNRVLSLMRQGHDRRDACEKARVKYKLFLQWYNDGLKNRNDLTRNFQNQVKEIESKNNRNVKGINNYSNKSRKSKEKSGKKSKKEKVKKSNAKSYDSSTKSGKDFKGFTPVTSVPNLKAYSIEKSDDVSSSKVTIVIPDKMKQILSLMEDGNSRSQAAKKACVSIEQILRWYGQGSKDTTPETAYFYRKLSEIEKKNKKSSKEINFIPKNKQNKKG